MRHFVLLDIHFLYHIHEMYISVYMHIICGSMRRWLSERTWERKSERKRMFMGCDGPDQNIYQHQPAMYSARRVHARAVRRTTYITVAVGGTPSALTDTRGMLGVCVGEPRNPHEHAYSPINSAVRMILRTPARHGSHWNENVFSDGWP